MCLYTHQSSMFTAKDDIVCYKLLKKRIFYTISIYQLFRYWRFKLYQTTLHLYKYPSVNICLEGFHSFQTIEAAVKYCINNHYANQKKIHLYKCIIPKGAQYVKGDSRCANPVPFVHKIDDSQQYCSDKIIIKNLVQNEFNKLIKKL